MLSIFAKSRKTKILICIPVFTLALWIWIGTAFAESNLNQCDRLENNGRLLHQQFKKTKVCKDSKIGKGWTDCYFEAYGTEIQLVGAIGPTALQKMQGFLGSGFYILAVDDLARVRPYVYSDFGILIRVEGKDNLEKSGCIYNEAYITLDAQVYSSGELNEAIYGPINLKLPKTKQEKTKVLQEDLKILGFHTGEINGALDSETITAIDRYKKSKGLPQKTPINELIELIEMDTALKLLDKLKGFYEKGAMPKPPLEK